MAVCGSSLPAREIQMELLPMRSHSRGAVFYLDSDGIDGYHEDKQHQYTRCKGVAQIYGVVQPRVIEWMRIYDDGLEEGHCLLLRSAFGIEGGAGGGSRCQFAHHLHILEEQ